jgi:outer membrane protein
MPMGKKGILVRHFAIFSASVAAALIIYAPIARADDTTMPGLAAIVVDTNPQIDAQRAAVRALEARISAARGGYLPSVEANALSQKRHLNLIGNTGDSTFVAAQASVEARLRLFDGFRTSNAVDISTAELSSGRAILDGTISDVLLDLLRSASDVHRDRLVRGFAQQQYDSIAEQLRGTSRRLSFGEATKTDESQATARLATSSTGILSATESLEQSAAEFEAVSGRPADAVPPLPELAMLPVSLEDATTIAQAESPRLLAAKATAAAAQKGVAYARGALAPTVDVVGGYDYITGGIANLFTGRLPEDRSALYAGVELRVPIFQGGRDYAEVRRAKALSDQRMSQVDQAAREVVQEVTVAWSRWKSATAIIDAARTAVSANERAADGVRKESIGGARTLLDVLDAQNELLAARVALERALRNEFVARATVLATVGRLTPQLVTPVN